MWVIYWSWIHPSLSYVFIPALSGYCCQLLGSNQSMIDWNQYSSHFSGLGAIYWVSPREESELLSPTHKAETLLPPNDNCTTLQYDCTAKREVQEAGQFQSICLYCWIGVSYAFVYQVWHRLWWLLLFWSVCLWVCLCVGVCACARACVRLTTVCLKHHQTWCQCLMQDILKKKKITSVHVSDKERSEYI